MRRLALLAVLACAIEAMAADFGSPGGPEPAPGADGFARAVSHNKER